jgi:methylmalonyl-CoA mutase
MSAETKQTDTGKLLEGFPPVNYDQWRKLVEAELKGAPFEKKMFTDTYEGIKLHPLYTREDSAKIPHFNSWPGAAPFARGAGASGYLLKPWVISQEIASSSPSDFNHFARNFSSRGLNGLNMVLDRATRNGYDPDWAQPEEVGFGGLSISTVDDLKRAIEGLELEKTSLFVRSGASALPFAALLVALVRMQKKSTEILNGCIEMDPLGVLSHEGVLPQSLPGAYGEMAALTRWASIHAPRLQTICVHSRAWHEAGGSAVQELAFTLATGVDYLREMHRRGVEVDTAAPKLRFAVTVGTNFFMEIAKLRALRMLWSCAVSVMGGGESAQKPSLHVRTSQWNKSILDPCNNMLRATVEAFAGVLGGCDSMQAGAYDEVAREPDDFSQRIARNTQLILQRECSLEGVIDPAGGSWYIESLASELSVLAWKLFQEIEKLGGMGAALQQGFPQQVVRETADRKAKSFAQRRDVLVGVNQYANISEKRLEPAAKSEKNFPKLRRQQVGAYRMSLEDNESRLVLEKLCKIVDFHGADLFEACVDAVSSGATLGEMTRALRINDSANAGIKPVRLARVASAFEKLRDDADAYAKKHHKPPGVFLCNMGSLKDYKARAEFSRGFFNTGGYEVTSPNGFKTPADAAKAFAESKALIAVICGQDEQYPAIVPEIVKAVREAKPGALIVLAGWPQDQIEAHKKSGVDEFIHIRADAAALLEKFHKTTGVSK